MKTQKAAMQRLFCYYYAESGNIEESAIRAGFPQELALVEGLRALAASGSQKLISQLAEKNDFSQLIQTGLKRLAFGSAADAVRLAFSEGEIPSSEIAKMDFFNVSEIKKVKGGGVEIKVFDRQKALEKLIEFESGNSNRLQMTGLINAIKESCEGGFDEEG